MTLDYESTREYFLSKPESTEDFPFGPEVAVFKVRNKMFGLIGFEKQTPQINLKCDPYRAASLRDQYEAVIPGYHMNKLHWNTVILDSTVPDDEVRDMIDHSYALVVKGLKKVDKNSLFLKYGKEQVMKGL